jgi:hypothetical protein
VVGAQAAPVQRLQFFLSESSWDAAVVNRRRLETLWTQDALRPHAEGVLIVDDSGDRKAGRHTAHVGGQYLLLLRLPDGAPAAALLHQSPGNGVPTTHHVCLTHHVRVPLRPYRRQSPARVGCAGRDRDGGLGIRTEEAGDAEATRGGPAVRPARPALGTGRRVAVAARYPPAARRRAPEAAGRQEGSERW